MRALLIATLVVVSSFLFIKPTLADICTDVEQKSGLKLNEAECYVLEQVEKGKEADLEKRFSKEKDLVIRADFLKNLLTGTLPNLKVTEKGVKIKNAFISEALDLRGETIPFPVQLYSCTFEEKVSFDDAQLLAKAGFAGVQFLSEANFRYAQFSSETNFSDARFTKVNFGWAQFSADASFSDAKFARVDFERAHFAADANFIDARFSSEARFNHVHFSAEANFSDAKFARAKFFNARFLANSDFEGTYFSSEAYFSDAEFSGKADFEKARFFADADFSNCKFRDSSDFRGCYYHNNSKQADFEDVTGFSNMQIEWEYDPEKFDPETDEGDINRRGLKDHLKYNETFYIALIKNYREMGWFREADDCYYTYRVEKRNQQIQELNEDGESKSTSFSRFWERTKLFGEWLLLGRTFGYGVRPDKIFITFLAFWIPFSFYYVGFVRSNYGQKLSWWKAWNPFFQPSRFLWSLVYSLDTITPGVNFESLKSLKRKVLIKSDSKRILYARRFQQILGWYWAALFLILFSKIWIR